jgi:hypothetical protein
MTQAAVLASNASLMTTPSGTAPGYMARAWVNFNGTGTVAISASGNVTSITDNASGDYTINFTSAMSDANYCMVSMGRRSSGTNPNSGYGAIVSISSATAPTTNAVRIWTTAIVASSVASSIVQVEDFPNVNVAVFR